MPEPSREQTSDSCAPAADAGAQTAPSAGVQQAPAACPAADGWPAPAACPSPGAPGAHPAQAVRRKRNAVLFFVVLVVWLAFDIATKSMANSYNVGQTIAGPFFGVFQLKLVHNTGMAWGMLSDSTFLLGIVSVVVCLVLTVYFFVVSEQAPYAQSLGMALVVAGGLGNAIDRFSQGYVVDFIDLAFMDFPVFNIADIGVTCGFVLFFATLVYSWRKDGESETQNQSENQNAAAKALGSAEKAQSTAESSAAAGGACEHPLNEKDSAR